MRKTLSLIYADPVWSKVAGLITILFFAFLADAILSDWIPVYMQTVLGSAFLMGLVMSFSSVVGLVADFVFPQVLRGTTVRRLLLLAILSGIGFALVSFSATFFPWAVVFLVGMAIWGVYYEFLGFASQQFVVDTAEIRERPAVWGVMGVFKSLAYFLGPIVAGVLATQGDRVVVVTAGVLGLVAYLLLFVLKAKSRPVTVEVGEINLVAEAQHWWILFPHVWPMLVATLMLGLVDATFWTTGTVLTEVLAKESFWGGLFLPMYMLPSLFVGFVIVRWGIYQGKKKWAELFMLFGAVALALLILDGSIFFMMLMVLISSTFLSLSYPLIDAVYSDIVARMGRERKHLLGLSHSMVSVAYIAGPVLSGFVASRIGERLTFVSIGVVLTLISVLLLATTPKKLKLPQKEIATWG